MLFDYFDNGTFYKDIINSIEDNKKDNLKDNKKDNKKDNRKTIIKLQPGLTIIRHGRIVHTQGK
jgi:hypothetical protein